MQTEQKPARRRFMRWVLGIPLAIILLFSVYTWISLTWSYAEGERAGYVQKFSKRGWVFKTWEGEISMMNLPGVTPEKFYFSVRDDSVAAAVTRSMGKRVALSYEQHKGIPVNWFMETEYVVVGVRVLD